MTAENDDDARLQPLRIPPGWRIGWNTLMEGPDEPARFGAKPVAVFQATDEHARLLIDVDWVDDAHAPLGGCYLVRVVHAPWPRTPKGRRRKGVLLDFDWENPKHRMSTTSKAELVAELERLFLESYVWSERS